MNLSRNERIQILVELGALLSKKDDEYQEVAHKAFNENAWFVLANIDKAVDAICTSFLEYQALVDWVDKYPESKTSRRVGLIMAGNIPLVGFHDLLAVFISGHHALVKLSSKDSVLMKYVLRLLFRVDERTKDYFTILDRLKDFEAVIATGSNNTSRYFEYYFSKYPNIIRKNRNGTAILQGDESQEDLQLLCQDIFDYFGLGCRNVTKIYVPAAYDFSNFLASTEANQLIFEHHKYRNNYDYNYALYLLNKDVFLASKNLILKEDTSYLSRIACLHYESYESIDSLNRLLEQDREMIQCVVSKTGTVSSLPIELGFGLSQQPSLSDYADGVDTMEFLSHI